MMMKSFKGKGQKGREVVFYNNPQELLKKLAVILGEMEAGNTSLKMRNMGQTILDTLLENGTLNKSAYQDIVKKYFIIKDINGKRNHTQQFFSQRKIR